jgi:hypothetical protein
MAGVGRLIAVGRPVAVQLRAVAWPVVAGISALAALTGAGGVVWPGAGQTLLPLSFALLAAGAAVVLDEPASLVVDVTPAAGPVRWTAVRAVALLVPLGVGAVLVLALAVRGVGLSWPDLGLALGGNILLGFAVACVLRRRVGEPGPVAASATVAVLVVPGLLPGVSRWVHTFPAAARNTGGLPVTVWWGAVGAVCVAAVGRSLLSR